MLVRPSVCLEKSIDGLNFDGLSREFDLYATLAVALSCHTASLSATISLFHKLFICSVSKKAFLKHNFPMNNHACLMVGRSTGLLVGLCVVILIEWEVNSQCSYLST